VGDDHRMAICRIRIKEALRELLGLGCCSLDEIVRTMLNPGMVGGNMIGHIIKDELDIVLL